MFLKLLRSKKVLFVIDSIQEDSEHVGKIHVGDRLLCMEVKDATTGNVISSPLTNIEDESKAEGILARIHQNIQEQKVRFKVVHDEYVSAVYAKYATERDAAVKLEKSLDAAVIERDQLKDSLDAALIEAAAPAPAATVPTVPPTSPFRFHTPYRTFRNSYSHPSHLQLLIQKTSVVRRTILNLLICRSRNLPILL